MFEELGNTPDEVADGLRARKIKGVRNAARFLNPIVRLALGSSPNAYGMDLILVDRLRIVFADGRTDEVVLPESVAGFLANFHRGLYPDLEMPNGEC